MGKFLNFEILLITLDIVVGMVGHNSFTTVVRNIPTFTCNSLCNYFTCEQK